MTNRRFWMEKKRPTANDIKRVAKDLKKNGFHVHRYHHIMALKGKLSRNIPPFGFSACANTKNPNCPIPRPGHAIVSINWSLDEYVAVRIWPDRERELAQKALDVVYGKGVFDVDNLEHTGYCIKLPLDLSQIWMRRKK